MRAAALLCVAVVAVSAKRRQAAPPNLDSFSPLTDSANFGFLGGWSGKGAGGWVECAACRTLVKGLHFLWTRNSSQDCVAELVAAVCASLKIQKPTICAAISSQYKEEVLFVLGRLVLEPAQVCGLLFSECGDPFNPLHQRWNVSLPGHKPPPKPLPEPKAKDARLRILHLSDIHIDDDYAIGSEVQCGNPLCCRRQNGKGVKEAAGFWGTVGFCDIPPWTLDNMLDHIARNEKVDLILWTGDLAAHNVWSSSRAHHALQLEQLSARFLRFFPGMPVFSAVGNHEAAPTDSFPSHGLAPPQFSTDTLYRTLAQAWAHWLPNDTQQGSIKLRASYSVPVHPGLRLVSLNTQYCDTYNFWLYLNATDPDGTLDWLVKELSAAEEKDEAVYIIGHIPPGDSSCHEVWSANYYGIVNRFEGTIRGQFFGHTHYDAFSVFYDLSAKERRPSNVAWMAPSVTTYHKLFPSYRIYTVDGVRANSTWAVLDHETHYLNITEANISNRTDYTLEYKAKESYNLTSLSAAAMDGLINKFLNNATLFRQYNKRYTRTGLPRCSDRACQFQRLCEMRAARSGNKEPLCGDLPQPPPKAEKSRLWRELRARLGRLRLRPALAQLGSACRLPIATASKALNSTKGWASSYLFSLLRRFGFQYLKEYIL